MTLASVLDDTAISELALLLNTIDKKQKTIDKKQCVMSESYNVKMIFYYTCYTIIYYTILYYTILYYTILYYTIQRRLQLNAQYKTVPPKTLLPVPTTWRYHIILPICHFYFLPAAIRKITSNNKFSQNN